jgi:hypothetical protein
MLLESQQVTEREPHFALAMAIDVLSFDAHLSAVAQDAFHHDGHFTPDVAFDSENV